MAINPDLLIAAAVMQDPFVDKDGTPMAGGTITCYQDNSRTTLKNWYYQSSNFADSSGKYTFSPLPNPLTLSAAGTITDINGVDTIPFFYPYSEIDETVNEPYYITIVNYAQTNQITRPNFPYNPQEVIQDEGASVDNYIINNVFWRNAGTVNLTNVTQMVVCPSQHDGFQYPDIQFIKTITGATDTLTFTKFLPSTSPILTGDITPEYYINHTCSTTDVGQTQKCYQFPISLHLETLANTGFTVTIQAQNAGGTAPGENVIKLFLLQDTGTGTTPPVLQPLKTITLNIGWTKYEEASVFPSVAGLTLGTGQDDAWYLQVQMPLTQSCSINFTRPSIYLTSIVPTNSFETYDQVDTVINSPRTGDLRVSLNNFYPFGWVPVNGGVIGLSASSGTPGVARANADTWQLYNLIWTAFSAFSTGNSTSSGANPIAQMYTSTGTAIGYGAGVTTPTTAIQDFTANKQLALTQLMGRVVMGTVPVSSLLTPYNGTVTSATNAGGFLLLQTNANLNLFSGCPFTISNTTGAYPSGLLPNTIYYMMESGTNQFYVATGISNSLTQTAVAYTSGLGAGTTTINLLPLGTITGEYDHTSLLVNTLLTTVTPTIPSGVGTVGQLNMKSTVQAGVFMNMFMKL